MGLSSPAIVDRIWAKAFRPDPLLTVSEWADRHRVLSTKASAEPGRWRTSRTPYLREPMDRLSITDPAEWVVIVAGAQVGKTEAGNNWLGYTIDIAPCPMLAIQPTVDIAKRFSKQRLASLIEESERLRSKVKPSRSRDSGNTLLSKEFYGGILLLGGANSAAGLRSMPIRALFADEVDAFPGDVEGEGDPVDLAVARTRTFARRKVLLTSTPTIAGQSRIWAAYEETDQRRFYVPCPHCGHRQTIEWERIEYDVEAAKAQSVAPLAPVLRCVECEEAIPERHKTQMLEEGEWRPINPDGAGHGYHISSLYSPLGWFSWADAARMHEKAKGNEERMRVFVNTVLGLPYEQEGDAPSWEALYRRRERYTVGTVPEGGLILTAGCDVQRSPGRVEVEVVAWGPNLESWSVDYAVFHGDTGTIQTDPGIPCVWRDVYDYLCRRFPLATGGSIEITKAAVDSGDQTSVVYAAVRGWRDSRIMATKGRDGEGLTTILGLPTPQEVNIRGKRIPRGIRLWPIGTHVAKHELYGWLRAEPPLNDGDPVPRGFCHFPQYDEPYFRGLTAEEVQKKIHRGFPKYYWVKTYARNEPLDCRIMARAALVASGADRWTEDRWEARRRLVLSGSKEAPVTTGSPSSQPATPRQAEPQKPAKRQRTGWLDSSKGRLGGRGGRWLG